MASLSLNGETWLVAACSVQGWVPCALGQGAAVLDRGSLGREGATRRAAYRVWVQSASVSFPSPHLSSLHLGACPSTRLAVQPRTPIARVCRYPRRLNPMRLSALPLEGGVSPMGDTSLDAALGGLPVTPESSRTETWATWSRSVLSCCQTQPSAGKPSRSPAFLAQSFVKLSWLGACPVLHRGAWSPLPTLPRRCLLGCKDSSAGLPGTHRTGQRISSLWAGRRRGCRGCTGRRGCPSTADRCSCSWHPTRRPSHPWLRNERQVGMGWPPRDATGPFAGAGTPRRGMPGCAPTLSGPRLGQERTAKSALGLASSSNYNPTWARPAPVPGDVAYRWPCAVPQGSGDAHVCLRE